MYEIITVPAFQCHCEKCGHDWISRREEVPTHCANKDCPNPSRWNIPGRSRKYQLKPEIAKAKPDADLHYEPIGDSI